MSDAGLESKTFVQVITAIPIVGEWATTLLALGPPYLATSIIFRFSVSENVPGVMLLFAVLSVPWILWLQRKGRIVIVLPIIPIPIIYLTPLWIVIGIVKLI